MNLRHIKVMKIITNIFFIVANLSHLLNLFPIFNRLQNKLTEEILFPKHYIFKIELVKNI